ncbi:MAG: hypothetical protein CMH53_10835 [Myxococcales bacterium]|nr:hypothetical protein [Myxococcales bacterium]
MSTLPCKLLTLRTLSAGVRRVFRFAGGGFHDLVFCSGFAVVFCLATLACSSSPSSSTAADVATIEDIGVVQDVDPIDTREGRDPSDGAQLLDTDTSSSGGDAVVDAELSDAVTDVQLDTVEDVAADLDSEQDGDSTGTDACTAWQQAPISAVKGWAPPTSKCAKPGFAAADPAKWVELTTPTVTKDASGCVIWRDLDGDGLDDLAWTTTASNEVTAPTLWISSRSVQGWSNPVPYPLYIGDQVLDCTAADLDRDGIEDVILATSRGARILRGGQSPAFKTETWLPAIARKLPTGAVVCADVDRDGWVDIYLARHTIRQDGCSMFSCESKGCTPQAGHVGAEDLTLRNILEKKQRFERWKGGHWGISGSVSVKDINHDGWLDLWLASAEGTGRVAINQDGQSWWYGNASAVSHSRVGIWTDLDLDGIIDRISGGLEPTVWHGQGALNASEYADGALLPADVNDDGWPELIRLPSWRHPSGDAQPGCSQPRQTAAGQVLWGPVSTSAKPKIAVLAASSSAPSAEVIPALAMGRWNSEQAPGLAWISADGVLRMGRWLASPTQHHLTLHLQASESAPGTEGAVVEIQTLNSTRVETVEAHPGRGAMRAVGLRVGLGAATQIKEVRVWWPSGRRSVLNNVQIDTSVTLKETDSIIAPACGTGGDAATTLDAGVSSDAGAGSDQGVSPSNPVAVSDVPWSGPPALQKKDLSALSTQGLTAVSPKGLDTSVPSYARCTAVADWDQDGDDDIALIFMTKQSSEVRVWLGPNKGVKVTSLNASFFVPAGDCAVTDVNNDGVPDLVVAGSPGLLLLRGNGKGGFVDDTVKRLPTIMNWNAYSVTPADIDGDGDIDLHAGVSAGGIGCGNLTCQEVPGEFYCFLNKLQPFSSTELDRALRLEANGKFTEQTQSWQMPPGALSPIAAVMPMGNKGGALWVTDDFGPHHQLQLTPSGLVRKGTAHGLLSYAHGMGWGVGDFNADGLWDLALADLGPSLLYMQRPVPASAEPVWADEALAWGVAEWTRDTSDWSPLVADFNHDGRDDLFIGTAAVCPPGELSLMLACKALSSNPPQHDLLFLNKNGQKFDVIRTVAEPDPVLSPDAVAQALIDFDGDGDLDIIQVRASGRLRMLRNDLPALGKSAFIRLVGPPTNRLAVGSIVRAKVGSLPVSRHVGTVAYGGAGMGAVHFGLGTHAQMTSVEVRWPDGKVKQIGTVKAGQSLSITYP